MSRRTWLWITGLASLTLLAVLAVLDERMQATGGPGIIPFEVAGSLSRAREIQADWGEPGQRAARQSLWLDYAYLVAYGAFLALAVAAVRDAARRRNWRRLAAVGGVLVAFPVAAAVCDAAENTGLLITLSGAGGSTAPLAAAVFAYLKFALMTATTVYLLAALIRWATARVGGQARA